MSWHTIANGQVPDGGKFMENWNYVCQQEGTLTEMMAVAALNPTVKFLCIITDWGGAVAFYTGDVSKGTNGFVPLGG